MNRPTFLFLVLTAAFAAPVLGGCGQVEMTPDTLAALASVGGDVAGQVMVPKPLSVDLAKKTLCIIDDLRPIAQSVQRPEQLTETMAPAVSALAERYIEDATARGIAKAAINAAVAVGQSYLVAHHDLAKEIGVSGYVTDAALLGFRNGLEAAIAREEGAP